MNWAQIIEDGLERAVLTVEGRSFVFSSSLRELLMQDVAQRVNDARSALALGGVERDALAEGELTLPVCPQKVLCVGLNYRDHAAEVGMDLPDYPAIFTKFANALVGPNDDIELPAPDQSVKNDWEVELALVVGKRVRRVSEAEAVEAIFGYTVANDVSVRDWQGRTSEWFQGKNWDRSTPLGPVIVPADRLDLEAGLTLSCRVDGVERQKGSTANLLLHRLGW